MKKNIQRPNPYPMSGRVFYLTALIAAMAIAAAGYFTFSSDSNTVSAQKNVGREVATQEMIDFSLNLRSASNYTVFADKGVYGRGGSSIAGSVGDGLRDEAGTTARKALANSMDAIRQLPCTELTGGLGGKVLGPGVYCLASAELAGELVLDGQGNQASVFIFKVDGELSAKNGSGISLSGGAQASNVFFAADSAVIGSGSDFRGSILSKNDIDLGAGATVIGRTMSLGKVAMNENAVGGGTGILEICKRTIGEIDISDRIFRFTVSGVDRTISVPANQCSSPIVVPAGPAVITELNDGVTIHGDPWSGNFQLLNVEKITAHPESSLGLVNLSTRTANVNIVEGPIAQQLTLRFTNIFAITGFVELCKLPALNFDRENETVTPDPDVQGFWTYNVEGVYSVNQLNPNVKTLQTFTVPVNQCGGPIAVTIHNPTPSGDPLESTVRVSELGRVGFYLESVETVIPDREVGTEVLGRRVNASGAVVANPDGGYVTVRVIEGAEEDETRINFFNRTNPGLVKVCKIAGPGIPVNTRFRFEVRGRGPTTAVLPPFGPVGPVVREVIVRAGEPADGGNCVIVPGFGAGIDNSEFQTFVIGTHVLVTEVETLDPVPLSAPLAGKSGSVSGKTGTSTKTTVRGGSNQSNLTFNSSNRNGGPGTVPAGAPAARSESAVTGASGLNRFITETGLVSLSVDAIGTNNESGVVMVQKAAGATVRRAFLMAATIPGAANAAAPTIADGEIQIDDVGVDFEAAVGNSFVDGPDSFNLSNYKADVTSLVSAKINSAPPGLVNFTIEEGARTALIDGVTLAVILDDPTKPSINSIVLHYGALQAAGDTFTLALDSPIDKAAPGYALDMSLGISYGFQPSDQFSTIDVGTNTRAPARVTSSAGGQDDGSGVNGALITAGGIDDTNANPADPNGPATDPRTDDELYNLDPFVNNGDTAVNINTFNPSNNDNIFFAGFYIGANSVPPGDPHPVSRIRSSCGFSPDGTIVQGIEVDPNPNLPGHRAIITARSAVCEVEFTNFVFRPAELKVCKIAGAGVAVGTPFTFDVALVSPVGPGNIPLFPPFTTSVVVNAGPADQDGGCALVDGSDLLGGAFNQGQTYTITERVTNPATTVSAITSITSADGLTVDLANRKATLSGPDGVVPDVTIVTFTNTAGVGPGTLAYRAPYDFDGDNKSDLSIYRSSTGSWWWAATSQGGTHNSVNWGMPTDK
ncbi:MAG: ice-binding family protein, partial [Pyrinomonadaceae bacterium]